MITPQLVQILSDYNTWQNASVFGAADALSADERSKPRGAFWGSIEGTLNHLLWGDRMIFSRVGRGAPPEKQIADSVHEGGDWISLKRARNDQDAIIATWAATVTQSDLDTSLTYVSAVTGAELTRNIGLMTVHMFNHQTHHRGQVHAMLTAAGAAPEDTDLPLMPGL